NSTSKAPLLEPNKDEPIEHRTPLPAALVVGPATFGSVASGLTYRQNFSVIRDARQAGGVLARLICVRCRVDTKNVLRLPRCGALCPTSQIGSAVLKPSAFAFYVLYFGGGRDILVCLTRSGMSNARRFPPPVEN